MSHDQNLADLFGPTFMGLAAGDLVEYRQYAGLGRNGPEYRPARGRVARSLTFADHVVLNIGGKHGTPAVVNAENFIRVVRRAR
jgi:hypothetical protein